VVVTRDARDVPSLQPDAGYGIDVRCNSPPTAAALPGHLRLPAPPHQAGTRHPHPEPDIRLLVQSPSRSGDSPPRSNLALPAAAQLRLPVDTLDQPQQCVTTRYLHTSKNKQRCPLLCLKWTPEGRRLITGAMTGEMTLWNGLMFNFETILQGDSEGAVRCMLWSHRRDWMVTGGDTGKVIYWQNNMNPARCAPTLPAACGGDTCSGGKALSGRETRFLVGLA